MAKGYMHEKTLEFFSVERAVVAINKIIEENPEINNFAIPILLALERKWTYTIASLESARLRRAKELRAQIIKKGKLSVKLGKLKPELENEHFWLRITRNQPESVQ